jgi:hypothetical protein
MPYSIRGLSFAACMRWLKECGHWVLHGAAGPHVCMRASRHCTKTGDSKQVYTRKCFLILIWGRMCCSRLDVCLSHAAPACMLKLGRLRSQLRRTGMSAVALHVHRSSDSRSHAQLRAGPVSPCSSCLIVFNDSVLCHGGLAVGTATQCCWRALFS